MQKKSLTTMVPIKGKVSNRILVQQNIDAHYRNMARVKSTIDNKCPKSMRIKSAPVKRTMNTSRSEPKIYSSRAALQDSAPPIENKEQTEIQNGPPGINKETIEYDDLLDRNKAKFTQSAPFTPRILKTSAESKLVKNRKIYNPTKIKSLDKTNRASNSYSARSIKSEDDFKFNDNFEETHKLVEPQKVEKSPNKNVCFKFLNDVTREISEKEIRTVTGMKQIFEANMRQNKYNMTNKELSESYEMFLKDLNNSFDTNTSIDNSISASINPKHVYENQSSVPEQLQTSLRSYEDTDDILVTNKSKDTLNDESTISYGDIKEYPVVSPRKKRYSKTDDYYDEKFESKEKEAPLQNSSYHLYSNANNFEDQKFQNGSIRYIEPEIRYATEERLETGTFDIDHREKKRNFEIKEKREYGSFELEQRSRNRTFELEGKSGSGTYEIEQRLRNGTFGLEGNPKHDSFELDQRSRNGTHGTVEQRNGDNENFELKSHKENYYDMKDGKIEEANGNRAVHFASMNEEITVNQQDLDNHSLTDVSSIQQDDDDDEDDDDINNNSLNETQDLYKSQDDSYHNAKLIKLYETNMRIQDDDEEVLYEDDFEDVKK